jgi:hypothetical protein
MVWSIDLALKISFWEVVGRVSVSRLILDSTIKQYFDFVAENQIPIPKLKK